MNLLKYIFATIILFIIFASEGIYGVSETARTSLPKTRAEISEYRQTSSVQDVVRFIEELQGKSQSVSMQFIGKSDLGRRIPMVICSRPLITSPGLARSLGRPIVYVQANIHAGEVEGKEAVQMILRDRLQEPTGGLLDKIILLVVPVFNIDGNEALGPQKRNRSNQNGPEMVGERTNGQGLDINRDYVKLESPEARASLQYIFNRWDPDVFIDLHATNGTIHGYQLTYAPPLNPNTEEGILHFTRDDFLPGIREILDKKYGLKTFDYGNLSRGQDEPAWNTFSPDARYATNYLGLRNRISILSEAMSYLSFEDRVTATYRFVNVILDEIARRGPEIVRLTRRADLHVINRGNEPESAPAMGVRFEPDERGREEILLEKSDTPGIRRRSSPLVPPEDFIEVEMPVFDRFRPTRTSRYPAAYIIPSDLVRIVELLQLHGIEVRKLRAGWQGETEVFVVEEITKADRAFQGHNITRLEGHFEVVPSDLPAGNYMVSTAQPLGVLVFHLLEPESLDGLAAWSFLDEKLEIDRRYPVLKILGPVNCPTEIVRN